jgi:hypothetical protein
VYPRVLQVMNSSCILDSLCVFTLRPPSCFLSRLFTSQVIKLYPFLADGVSFDGGAPSSTRNPVGGDTFIDPGEDGHYFCGIEFNLLAKTKELVSPDQGT